MLRALPCCLGFGKQSCFVDQASLELSELCLLLPPLWVGRGTNLQEEILHDVVIVWGAAIWQEAGCKDDDGVETFPVVSWEKASW